MIDKTEKKKLAILRLLNEAGRPLGSAAITDKLRAQGLELSERTVRYYLLGLDREGLTEGEGKRGRTISTRGVRELQDARVIEKVGFLAAKIDQMAYNMDFDLARKSGSVVINVSLVNQAQLMNAAPYIQSVFAAGYSMGNLMTLLRPGERFGNVVVPDNMAGIGTVCSITINGVLLAHGIPTQSRFGGLLELRDRKPARFVQIITYEGTSIDPLEVFIASGMTELKGACSTGNGRIGVGFREMPADSIERVNELEGKLRQAGLGGILALGHPGQPLFDIPVSEGRVGAVLFGGLNPTAILVETAIKVHSRALAGFADYGSLFPYWLLEDRIRQLD
jgi:HTH-type transcriptional regulator, global nitrogen regulator NrpRI